MNSLNILSSRVIGQTALGRPRSRSQSEALNPVKLEDSSNRRSFGDQDLEKPADEKHGVFIKSEDVDDPWPSTDTTDEKKPLLETKPESEALSYRARLRRLVKRIADALTALLSTIGAPVAYVASCFREEDGRYSPVIPLKRIRRALARRKVTESTTATVGLSSASNGESWDTEKPPTKRIAPKIKLERSYS